MNSTAHFKRKAETGVQSTLNINIYTSEHEWGYLSQRGSSLLHRGVAHRTYSAQKATLVDLYFPRGWNPLNSLFLDSLLSQAPPTCPPKNSAFPQTSPLFKLSVFKLCLRQ